MYDIFNFLIIIIKAITEFIPIIFQDMVIKVPAKSPTFYEIAVCVTVGI